MKGIFGNYDAEIDKINDQILSIRTMDVRIAEQLKVMSEHLIELAQQQVKMCEEMQRIERKIKP